MITDLLQLERDQRLGDFENGNAEEILSHAFFENVENEEMIPFDENDLRVDPEDEESKVALVDHLDENENLDAESMQAIGKN